MLLLLAWAEPAPAEDPPNMKDLAAQNGLTDEVIALFKKQARFVAEKTFDKEADDGFWKWVDANPVVRDALLVELYPTYDPEVAKRLQELRKEFGEKVDSHQHLALAFAFVWGSRKSLGKAPPMKESFKFYLDNEKKMDFSLTKTPWPLLTHVADNNVSLKERAWALGKYGRPSGKAYDHVPYDYNKLKGRASIGHLPYTLENLSKYGGICADKAYYASRLFKCFGVPAMAVSGTGARGSHAWVAWIDYRNAKYALADEGRFFSDKYYKGMVRSPMTGKKILDRHVGLLAQAVTSSYQSYLDALVGCYVFEMFEGNDRARALTLLQETVKKNPFCERAWRDFAQAAADGVLSISQTGYLYDYMLKKFDDHPDLTFEALTTMLSPALKDAKSEDRNTVNARMRTIENCFRLYRSRKRPDLSVALRCLQGRYLEALGRPDDARDLYMKNAEEYADEHYGFLEPFESALRLMKDTDPRKKAKFLKDVARKAPKYASSFNKRFNLVNPAYRTVVTALIKALRDAGRDGEANHWETEFLSD